MFVRAGGVRYARFRAILPRRLLTPWFLAASFLSGPVRAIDPLDPSTVARFARQTVADAVAHGAIPGAVMAVVSEGRIVLLDGYGMADVAAGRRVRADRTLFRVASISKLLTTAAILQEVEAGRLDLGRDVNHYLDRFRIAETFSQPVTLHDLLTHTAGFATDVLHYGVRLPAPRVPLAEYLDRFRPARLRRPGEIPSYDNYGFTLAGHLLQKASGTSFGRRVRDGLLTPLGMTSTRFSLDRDARERLALGYWQDGEKLAPYPPGRVNILPAAGLCSTGADMARFMIALLGGRPPEAARSLIAAVRQPMLTPRFGVCDQLPGRCYGFNRIVLRGRPVLRQTGKWPGYLSVMMLFPRQNAGFFLAYNLADGFRFGRGVSHDFVEQFIPRSPPGSPPGEGPPQAPPPLATTGSYVPTRTPQRMPWPALPGEILATVDEGVLRLNGRSFRPLGAGVYALDRGLSSEEGGPGERVAFWPPGAEVPTHLVTDRASYRRAHWWEIGARFRLVLGLTLTVLGSGLVWWPLVGLVKWGGRAARRDPSKSRGRPQWRETLGRSARAVGTLGCALAAGYVFFWFRWSSGLAPGAAFYGLPSPLQKLLAWGPWLPASFALTVVGAVAGWRFRLWTPGGRLHYTLVCLALGTTCLLLHRQDALFGS